MSTHLRVKCETCQVTGPMIRRKAGTACLGGNSPKPTEYPSVTWARFLDEHEDHKKTLVTDA